ncbi:MAG: hypothetical protein ACT4PV_11625 [Planctomycetaceae bacterium]
MRSLGAALVVGLKAPWERRGLAALLWLARLLPILLVFTLPVYDAARAASAYHPDAPLLLDPGADASGFAFAWMSDFSRSGLGRASETLFWLILLAWTITTFLAGGITRRLLPGDGPRSPLTLDCARFFGRFMRLAFLFLLLAYALDVWVNTLLLPSHEKAVLKEHTEGLRIERSILRGLVLLTLLHILGAVHSYARIDLVLNDRRSAFVAFLRGLVTLLVRLPSLFLLEVALLLASGAAVLLAWFVTRRLVVAGSASGVLAIGVSLGLMAFASFLRTGLELGVLAARCRLLAPRGEESRDETAFPPSLLVAEGGPAE